MRVGILGLCTSASFFILLIPFLHETIKIGPTGSNQYCDWPVVEIQTGIEEWVESQFPKNQEMTGFRYFDDEIDILLHQNEAEKSIKMWKPIFN